MLGQLLGLTTTFQVRPSERHGSLAGRRISRLSARSSKETSKSLLEWEGKNGG